MLKLANVHKGDILFDLGSGDGRIVVTAAKQFGIRATGIDINPVRIAEANENAQKNGVTGLVQFRNEDLFEADIKDASVVTLYLLTSLNLKLRPKLWHDLKPGTRIVSQTFDMGDWEPESRKWWKATPSFCGGFPRAPRRRSEAWRGTLGALARRISSPSELVTR